MSAPENARPIGKPPNDSEDLPTFECMGCGYKGGGEELLGVDDQETMWCPICKTSGWVWE